MVFQKFWVTDNAVWQIDAWIWASTTSLTLWVGQWSLFPTSQQFIWVLVQYITPNNPTSWVAKSEKVLVTNRTWDILTITRWYDWDTSTTFLTSDYFYLNITSKIIIDIQDESTRLENDKLNKWALRVGLLNAWKMFFSNWSKNETEITLWDLWKVLTSNWASATPTFETPTVSINWLTEEGTPTSWFFAILYNGTNNVKVTISNITKALWYATKTLQWVLRVSTDAEAAAWIIDTVAMTPKQIKDNYSPIPATTSQAWVVYLPIDAEVITWISTTLPITVKQAKDNYLMVNDTIVFTRDTSLSSWVVTYSHWLWKIPKQIIFSARAWNVSYWSEWSFSWKTNVNKSVLMWSTSTTTTSYSLWLKSDESWNWQFGYVSFVSTTQFSITWTKTWSPTGNLSVVAHLIA